MRLNFILHCQYAVITKQEDEWEKKILNVLQIAKNVVLIS